jgi:hypothetical protein
MFWCAALLAGMAVQESAITVNFNSRHAAVRGFRDWCVSVPFDPGREFHMQCELSKARQG